MRSRTTGPTGPASGGVRSPLPIADAAPMGLLGLDSAGNCGSANAKWGRLTGGDAERAPGFGRLDAVDPRDRDVDVPVGAAAETLAAPTGTSRTVRLRLARTGGAVTEPLAARMADPETFRQGEHAMRESGEATGLLAVARYWSRYSDAAHAEPTEIIRRQAAVAAAPPPRPAGVPAWTESVDA